MSVRACVYKDCDNYTVDNVFCGTKSFTLFRFPKSEERSKQWLRLGEVLPTIPERLWFMCSDHFDKKYLIVNQRRTTLVNTAVPNAYSAPNITVADDNEMAQTTNCLDMEVAEVLVSVPSDEDAIEKTSIQVLKNSIRVYDNDTKETEYCVGSTTMHEDSAVNSDIDETDEIGEYEVTCNYNDDDDDLITEETVHSVIQRVVTARATSPQSKRRRMQATYTPTQITPKAHLKNLNASVRSQMKSKLQQKSPVKMEQKTLVKLQPHQSKPITMEEIDATSPIDSKHVTTFIFKGEEYVQMPKEYYVQEKIEFMQKISSYESILLGLKQRLNNIDLP